MAAISEVSPPFHPQWPKRFDPALKSLLSKVGRVFWNILSVVIFPIGLIRLAGYYFRNLALRVIVPGRPYIDTPVQNYWHVAKLILRLLFNPENFKADLTNEGKQYLKEFNGEAVTFKAPDDAQLDGAFFPGKHQEKVILFVGGNAEQWESNTWLHMLKPLNASIFFINPRGIGNSSGSRYEDGYALDVYAAAEYLIHQQGIDPENIVFTGFSMGAANTTRGASLIQEKYPDKKIKAVNVNSFSSLHLEIQEALNKGFFGFLGRLGARLLSFNMDVKKDWDTLKGEKYIFYNPKDPVIPFPAQLATAVKKEPLGKSHLIKLNSIPNHIPFYLDDEYNTFHDVLLKLLQIDRSQTDLKLSWWDRAMGTTMPTLKERIIEQAS